MSLLPLGLNGYFPSHGRQTMCFLWTDDAAGGVPLLLDAGTGLGRLREERVRACLEGVERLDIVLTHYHLDHTVGLTYLSAAWGRAVRILAPAPPLVDFPPAVALGRLVGPPLFPLTLDEYPTPVELCSYSDGDELSALLGRPVAVRRQQHLGGSVGLRLGELAYVTDTEADPATVELAQDARLLLHEVWLSGAEAERNARQLAGHSAVTAVAEIAAHAGVAVLAPVHHHPLRDPARLDELYGELRAAAVVPVVRLEEGEAYELE
ncbi:MAG TPA: MBL fold metallo-hydrolase [Thermoanaerobaculia bacterium]|nr:MBL fold metallo-hydrolase [Thermoanaerobaculia bacterium]